MHLPISHGVTPRVRLAVLRFSKRTAKDTTLRRKLAEIERKMSNVDM
jgi:hypothetical protein